MNLVYKKLFFWRTIGPVIVAIFLNMLILPTSAVAQNPKASQWKQAGGKMILSVSHVFSTTWTSDGNSREKGLYWKGGFYDPVKKRQYAPWDTTVSKSVAPKLGQITVQGPGVIALFERTMGGASIYMRDQKTKATFHPYRNSLWLIGASKWDGAVRNFTPGEFWGRIKANDVLTIDVGANMSAYDNMMNTGEYSFRATQKVLESEVWFFPEAGGKVIKVIKISSNGNRIDITKGDVPCINNNSSIETPNSDTTISLELPHAPIVGCIPDQNSSTPLDTAEIDVPLTFSDFPINTKINILTKKINSSTDPAKRKKLNAIRNSLLQKKASNEIFHIWINYSGMMADKTLGYMPIIGPYYTSGKVLYQLVQKDWTGALLTASTLVKKNLKIKTKIITSIGTISSLLQDYYSAFSKKSDTPTEKINPTGAINFSILSNTTLKY